MSSGKWRPFCLGLNVLSQQENDGPQCQWHKPEGNGDTKQEQITAKRDPCAQLGGV